MQNSGFVGLVDWDAYRARAYDCVLDALARYASATAESGPPAPIFEVAIWTDVQAGLTGVSIETKAHALELKQQYVQMARDAGDLEVAKAEEMRPHSADPGGFQYHEFGLVQHPELEPLRLRAVASAQDRAVAEAATEASLLQVVARLVEEGAFVPIPREREVWVGVSSPRYWYDDVRPV